MFKILVVDDEKPARETIACLINWEDTDFKIVEFAKNGREALEKYNLYKPDLIITDIQMPIMDGLELIREIRKGDNEQKFIILSCHEKFQYAREAIKMGVSDYLLKDLLKPQDLYNVLEKIKVELDYIKNKELNKYNNEVSVGNLNEFEEAYRNAGLKSIIFEKLSEDKIKEYITNLGLNLKDKYFVVMCLILDDYKKTVSTLDYKEKKLIRQKIKRKINDSLNSMYKGECYYHKDGKFIIISQIEDINSQLKYFSDCHEISKRIRMKIAEVIDSSITIGISKGFFNLNDINNRYKEALDVTKYRIFVGKGKTLFYNTILVKVSSINSDIFEIRLSKIKESVENNNVNRIIKEIKNLYNNDIKGFMQYNYLKYVNTCLYEMIIEFSNKFNISYKEIFSKNYIPLEEVDKKETIYEISEWFCSAFITIVNNKSNKTNKRYSRRIEDAIEYIKSCYTENISLSDVADVLGIHKVYLSRLFKEETGENISNFIIKVKIEKAKKMILSTNYKLYEISEQVGFKNSQQFSVVFKKYTGLTPLEFRDGNFK